MSKILGLVVHRGTGRNFDVSMLCATLNGCLSAAQKQAEQEGDVVPDFMIEELTPSDEAPAALGDRLNSQAETRAIILICTPDDLPLVEKVGNELRAEEMLSGVKWIGLIIYGGENPRDALVRLYPFNKAGASLLPNAVAAYPFEESTEYIELGHRLAHALSSSAEWEGRVGATKAA